MTLHLKILFWNFKDIKHRLIELHQALIQKIKIDIILLHETHLSLNIKHHITNYHTYRNDLSEVHGKPAYGGMANLIHRQITHQLK